MVICYIPVDIILSLINFFRYKIVFVVLVLFEMMMVIFILSRIVGIGIGVKEV
jgi:hypothetical protein